MYVVVQTIVASLAGLIAAAAAVGSASSASNVAADIVVSMADSAASVAPAYVSVDAEAYWNLTEGYLDLVGSHLLRLVTVRNCC